MYVNCSRSHSLFVVSENRDLCRYEAGLDSVNGWLTRWIMVFCYNIILACVPSVDLQAGGEAGGEVDLI